LSRLPRFDDDASRELEDAALWYEEKKHGLGLRFLDAVERTLDRVGQFPAAGASVPRLPAEIPARRAPVAGFPYHVVYLELQGSIRVIAVAHDSRRPGYWHTQRR
jgi:toxin ParE1/3/4